jgi:type II secretory pathway pseudopilin PulG
MMDPTDRQATSRGFTVVELLVALGLAAVVFGLIVSFFADMGRSTTTQNASAAAQQTARAGVDFMAQELRLAGLDPLKSAGAGIEEISFAGTGNKIRFSADSCNVKIGDPGTCENPEPDGKVDGKNERVTYLYRTANRDIRRCLYETVATFGLEASDGSCMPLLEQVGPNPGNVPLFTFLDGNGLQITGNDKRGDIRTVVITLTVLEPAGRSKAVERTYSSRVRLRNIGH